MYANHDQQQQQQQVVVALHLNHQHQHQHQNHKQQQQQQQLQLQPSAQSKRKEKARIAARARRSQEANIIMEMAIELHISQEKLRRIDKATIVKLAIDYIKAHEMLRNVERELAGGRQALAWGAECEANENRQQQRAAAMVCSREELRAKKHEADEGGADNFERDCEQNCNSKKKQRQQGGSASSITHRHKLSRVMRQRFEQNSATATTRDCEKREFDEDDEDEEDDEVETEAEEEEVERVAAKRAAELHSAPRLTTASIFAPKTRDNCNPYFLMIEEKHNGKSAFVLKPDTEIQDEDDLTHLAPQAGDTSISFETDPLDGIPIDDLLVPSPQPNQPRGCHQFSNAATLMADTKCHFGDNLTITTTSTTTIAATMMDMNSRTTNYTRQAAPGGLLLMGGRPLAAS